MKILGIGIDIIENKRIENSIKNHRFKERIYSSKELKQSTLSKDKIGYFSKLDTFYRFFYSVIFNNINSYTKNFHKLILYNLIKIINNF